MRIMNDGRGMSVIFIRQDSSSFQNKSRIEDGLVEEENEWRKLEHRKANRMLKKVDHVQL